MVADRQPDGVLPPREAGYNLDDTYLSITWHKKLPAKDPYKP